MDPDPDTDQEPDPLFVFGSDPDPHLLNRNNGSETLFLIDNSHLVYLKSTDKKV